MNNSMVSFHNDAELKNQLVANLKKHEELDQIVQGTYWSDGKGCAVGCSIVDFGGETDNHKEYERLFGIPRALARIEDGIFEGLSVEDAKCWPGAFAAAVPVGVDLSGVVDKLMVYLLEGVIQYAKDDGIKAVKAVIDLYKRKISGEKIELSEWREARAAAYAAADARAAYADAARAARAAAYAADAAAADAAYAAAAYAAAYAADADAAYADAYAYATYAADAADAAAAYARQTTRKQQADKLIELLKAA